MRIACYCGAVFTSDHDADVCPHCRTPVSCDPSELQWVEELRSDLDEWESTAVHGDCE